MVRGRSLEPRPFYRFWIAYDKTCAERHDRCAAVFPARLNFSPEAVLCPPSSFPYHAARTVSSAVAGFSGNNRIKASHLRIKVLSTPLGRWFELAKTGHCSLGALRKPGNGVIQQLVPPH